MTIADDVVEAAFQSDEDFRKTLERVIKKDLGLSITDFGERSGISPSTLYKILNGDRDPNLGTLRDVVEAIRIIEGLSREKFIAVIAARPVLDRISEQGDDRGRASRDRARVLGHEPGRCHRGSNKSRAGWSAGARMRPYRELHGGEDRSHPRGDHHADEQRYRRHRDRLEKDQAQR